MDLGSLITIGLSKMAAEAYALLVEYGELKPPAAASMLKLSRTNAYKVLDKLGEMGLAVKEDVDGKVIYRLASPMALTKLTADYRAEAVVREEAMNKILQDLLAKYHSHYEQPDIRTYSGQKEVAAAYRTQIGLGEDIFFIHTKADVPKMTHETMHDIRTMPASRGLKRKGILNSPTGRVNWESHRRSKLDITWVDPKLYNAPVEWSITESSLLIVLYASEPYAILITDKVIAGAFMQLFNIINSALIALPGHKVYDKHTG